jgi:predicted lysophospholipase L1 biosynthesis ABC-type transport system permease subunit
MKPNQPYVQSGETARKQLNRKAVAKSSAPVAGSKLEAHRCRQSLRGFKQVINLFAVSAIIFTPLIGIMARDAVLAAVVALSFLLVIWLLEIMECTVKRRLSRALRRSETPEQTPKADKAREDSF